MKNYKKLLTILALFLPILVITFAKGQVTNSLIEFFSRDYVFTILLVIALAGAVIEILTPGFGLGGIISLVSFGIFFWGNILMGNSNWYALILFVAGILLIGFEIIIPGFGICGISGILAVAAALIIAMGDLYFAIFSLAIAIVISFIIGYFLFKKGIDSEVVNRLRLFTTTNTEQGFVSVPEEEINIGDELITSSVLRPTGFAINNGKKIEVISESGYISSDEKVVVTRLSGPRIYVKSTK
ncbi:nodulation protein NfeD [Peptoniphilus sp. MSJ-1]|uniref:Nodulation protein NfeD n=1 Tax=Peptoniphilus ovalis TaxID=2841503 RepID=A0ABS6FIQ3_9FIRM|nr:nodulation protein NfeD [Peptoniphilus ovalis]MBU5669948.1 nodulation protein NfeD [Peptoniphilus ovalis]